MLFDEEEDYKNTFILLQHSLIYFKKGYYDKFKIFFEKFVSSAHIINEKNSIYFPVIISSSLFFLGNNEKKIGIIFSTEGKKIYICNFHNRLKSLNVNIENMNKSKRIMDQMNQDKLNITRKISAKKEIVKIKYNNGDIYKGFYDFDNYHQQYFGFYKFSDNTNYRGEFYDNEFNGFGIYEFKNGDVFIGYFQNGQKSGFGKYIYDNGNEIKGYYEKDMLNGEAIFLDKIKKEKYIGFWKNNMRHGQGIQILKNGEIYRLTYEDNKLLNKTLI